MKTKHLLKLALFALVVPGAAFAQTQKAAGKLDEIAAPITHPTIFEDPRSYTEARPIYVFHKIDDDFVTGGGQATVYALQLRYAIDDRLSIIATKDGYVDLKTDAVLDDSEGLADLAAGVKYAVYKNDDDGQIATVGLRFEIPTGDEDIFQGQGDGAINPFFSGAIALGPVNLMAGTGFRVALDGDDSSFYDFNLHADTKLGPVHPLVELNLINVISAGDRLPITDEGEDFFNFGSSEADGNTLVSASVGARVDITDGIIFGVAYQFPLSSGDGSNLLDYRITSDLIFRF